ncbi:hypothetical protein K490DRAFT_58928 [Saccharata proteae CBS 121410]|uniref:Uncharacterized protein n=1 Tax=Saccharata proteae CBS 121410 TaxID=1314787 RepID=A0A9P4HSB0_9PEZI|nr:hypothetical protein K490DRAFT_58928 [Saccharata proteae CBS 121410]
MADHDKSSKFRDLRFKFSSRNLFGGQADENPVPSRAGRSGSPAPSTSSGPSQSSLRHTSASVPAFAAESKGKGKGKANDDAPKNNKGPHDRAASGDLLDSSSSSLRYLAGNLPTRAAESKGRVKGNAADDVSKSDKGPDGDHADEDLPTSSSSSLPRQAGNIWARAAESKGKGKAGNIWARAAEPKGKGKGKPTDDFPKNDNGKGKATDDSPKDDKDADGGDANENLPDPLLFLEQSIQDRKQALKTVDEGINHLKHSKRDVEALLTQTKKQIDDHNRVQEIATELAQLKAFIADSRASLGISPDEKVTMVPQPGHYDYPGRARANANTLLQSGDPAEPEVLTAEKKKKKKKRGGKKAKARNKKGKEAAEESDSDGSAAEDHPDNAFVAESSAVGAARAAALGALTGTTAASQISLASIVTAEKKKKKRGGVKARAKASESKEKASIPHSKSTMRLLPTRLAQLLAGNNSSASLSPIPSNDLPSPTTTAVFETASQRLRDATGEAETALDDAAKRFERTYRAQRNRFQGRLRAYRGEDGDEVELFVGADEDRKKVQEDMLAASAKFNEALERMVTVSAPMVEHVREVEGVGEGGVGAGEEGVGGEDEDEEELLPPPRRFGRLSRFATRSMVDLRAGLLGRSQEAAVEGEDRSVDDFTL